jgi:hypothetical protein
MKERENWFLFIQEYLALQKYRLADYALDIKRCCFDHFRKESKSNLVRRAALEPVVTIVRLQFPMLTHDKLEIRAMATALLEAYSLGRQAATLKGTVLSALGVFAELFPTAMIERMRQLLSLYMEALGEEFKSKKPELTVIAGALEGMSGVLVNARGDFNSNPTNVRTVYGYLCLALQSASTDDLKRYQMPRAALELLGKHAEVFCAHLTEGSETMYKLLCDLCKHRNDDLRRQAFNAMERFLVQVAEQIVSGRRSPAVDEATFK